MITITDKGAEKVRDFLNAQGADLATAGLRVGVRGGGCSGFQYNLAFDQERDGDAVFEDHGLKIVVDRTSLPYVTGSIIDYVDSMQGAGFHPPFLGLGLDKGSAQEAYGDFPNGFHSLIPFLEPMDHQDNAGVQIGRAHV